MTLENQVCSLELAKELKALGVQKESLFHWTGYDDDYRLAPTDWLMHNGGSGSSMLIGESLPAYTVAELGEMLPEKYRTHKSGKDWYYGIHQKKFNSPAFSSEADARATALVYVLSNKTATI